MAASDRTLEGLEDEIIRDFLLGESIRNHQWDDVVNLINGVSRKSRDAVLGEASRCGQWDCITRILQQGSTDVCWDSLLYEALPHRQWDCVTNIVQKGVSDECLNAVLHEAIRYDRWDVVSLVVQTGISVECRDVLLHEALRQQQWECVTQIMQQGVSLHCRDSAFKEAVQHNRWQCVAVLVKHGVSPDLIHLAVGHLIQQHHLETSLEPDTFRSTPSLTDKEIGQLVNQCKWDCITQFVRLGILSAEQRDYLCQEAVPWGHHECAVELLRQGVSPVNAQWIVSEVFRWGKWQLITDLMEQGQRLSRDGKKIFLSTAVAFRQWEAYLQMFRFQPATDSDLRETMVTLVNTHDHDILQQIIRQTNNGLRVFKQLCLTQIWDTASAFQLCVNLCAKERNLALYVAVTQGLTRYTLDLYEDTSVSKKSRRFALRHAIKQGDWDLVIQMASKPVTEASQRRLAFLAAIRQGKWRMALKLLDNGLTLSTKDAKFSVKMCRCLNELDGVVQLCLLLDSDVVGVAAMKTALHRSLETGTLKSFDTLVEHFLDELFSDERMLKALIKQIVKMEKPKFLVRLIRNLYDVDFCVEEVSIAVETILKSRKWNFLRSILDSDIYLSISHYLLIMEKVIHSRNAWRVCIPKLEQRCDDLDWEEREEIFCRCKDLPNSNALARWCCKRSLQNLSVLLSLKANNSQLLSRVLAAFDGEVNQQLMIHGMDSALREGKLDLVVVFLEHLDPNVDYDDLEYLYDSESRALLDKCRESGLSSWTIDLAIRWDEWDIVGEEMETCTDQTLIDKTIQEAAECGQWTLVENLRDRCSQNNDVLGPIFRTALEEGNLLYAKLLVTKLDMSPLHFYTSIMYKATGSIDNRLELVQLCIGTGISTHQDIRTLSPMRRALNNGQLPIVRLLYESGCSSNTELHSLKNDQTLRAQLQRQRREDIVQYLDHVASNPASLQQLCRLTVSHLVGCRPGRRDRVLSLPVPDIVCDFIMFSDLTD